MSHILSAMNTNQHFTHQCETDKYFIEITDGGILWIDSIHFMFVRTTSGTISNEKSWI